MKNIYLDFNRNKENLKRALSRIKKTNKDFFKDQIEGEDDLSYFINSLFEDNNENTYYISNTSLKEDKMYYTIRPKLTRELRSKLGNGKTIAIRTHPNNNNILVVDRIVDIYDTPIRNFEKEIACKIKIIKELKKEEIEENILEENIFSTLEPISRITGQNLKLWEEYLDWKLDLIKNKLVAVKYIKRYIEGESIVFELLCEKEEINNTKKLVKFKDMKVFQNKYSINRWKFKYHDDTKNYTRSQNLGGFISLEEPESLQLYLGQNFYKEVYEECEYSDPYIIKVRFEFSEENLEDIDQCPENQLDKLMNNILKKYEEEGYLSESAIGEFILIKRQKNILNSIKLGESYSPYLASWLFDISEANNKLDNFEIDNWLNHNLNKSQKQAVERILESPEVCLVQGAPGTGKTTVIAESIYQFAKQGKKVILSSQSNLAVDNVLDRLIMTPQVRAIRLCRSNKISEEGKKFSEEKVIESFYRSIADEVKRDYIDKYSENSYKFEILKDWIDKNKDIVIRLEKNKVENEENKLYLEDILDKVTREKMKAIITKKIDYKQLEKYKQKEIDLIKKSEQIERLISNDYNILLDNIKDISDYINIAEDMNTNIKTITREIHKLRKFKKDIEKRKKVNDFINEWYKKLTDKETIDNDNKYFMEKYIDSCNVIGVNCTESEKTLKKYNQTSFDVAIIDEVSKATPPELLIPMSKAKQCILVGDHRQLPPIFKDKIDEIKDKNESEQLEKDEQMMLYKYEYMVTASLFKDYFESADKNIKTALYTQYRMHPQIMDLINQFYEGKLKCGLDDISIKEKRQHGLTLTDNFGLPYVTPDRHVVWVDSSKLNNGESYYEKQSGTSKVNLLEIKCIINTLKSMEKEYINKGYNKKNRKDVGVISFYGNQVKLLRQEIKKIKFESLDIDVNTVDKFQGKEKSIILVSLVRNYPISSKEGGFVGSFERINVAFSRAKELLIIYGAKDMFEDYIVRLPNMESKGSKDITVYNNIINKLKQNGCFVDNSKILSDDDYKYIVGNRMVLKKIEISVPVFLYTNKITHFLSRRLVAIEWAIVESISRFSTDDVFKNMTIKTFFENELKIPNLQQLVKPCIYDLIELGIISKIDESEDIEYICIKDMYLTELGKSLIKIKDMNLIELDKGLIKEGKLASKDVKNLLNIVYSPFDNSISIYPEMFLQDEKAPIDVNLNENYYPYPRNEILEYINKNKTKLSWLQKNSYIKDVEALNVIQKYKIEKANIIINESGNLDLEINNSIYKDYIENNMNIYEILNYVGILDTESSYNNVKDLKEIVKNIESFIDKSNIQDKINDYVYKNKINIVRKVNYINIEEIINKFKDSSISNRIIVVLDKNIQNTQLDIFEKNKIIMYINDEEIVDEDVIYINEKGHNICMSKLKTNYKESKLYITAAYNYKSNLYSNKVIDNIEEILETIFMDNRDVLIAKGIWTNPKLIFTSIVDIVNKSDISVKEKVQQLLWYKNKIQQMYEVKNLKWQDYVLNICLDYISINNIDTNEKLSQILSYLNLDQIINNKECSDKLLNILIPKIHYLTTVKELEDFYSELEKININNKSIKNIISKENIYTSNIINELKERFDETDFINKLKSYTEIEENIKSLKDVEKKIKKYLKIESLVTFYKVEDFDKISRIVKVRYIKDMIDRWNNKLGELNAILSTYQNINLQTPIDIINKNINEFFIFMNKVVVEIPNGFNSVYVLDTNVFIHQPDILSYFKDNDYIVVPKKVIEELDTLKFKKSNLRVEINKAIEYINKRFKEEKLIFEEVDIDLLPSEYEATPDNMILSVAIKYKNFDTTLITSDKIFSAKANSEDIHNIDLKTFLEDI